MANPRRSNLTEERKEQDAAKPPSGTNVSKYKVEDGYDDGFLLHGQVTTISALLQQKDKDLSLDLEDTFGDTSNIGEQFLHGVLLKITTPLTNTQETYQYTPFKTAYASRFSKRPKTTSQTYKKCLLFGDAEDPKSQTFVLLEENNDSHNQLFLNKNMDHVTVGSRFAVKSPILMGVLKSGSFVIKTDRPLEVLTEPIIPAKALNPRNVSDSLRFFVLKGQHILLHRNSVLVPYQSKCNGRACDRLQAATHPNHPCGCWTQAARSDTLAKNTVFKQEFFFRDSNNTVNKVTDFTSLKWSKLMFQDGQILLERDELQQDRVFRQIQIKWRQMVGHVNQHGGWTIIGWYKRATKTEEDQHDNESSILSESVKINVSHLAPSTVVTLPREHQLDVTELRALLR